MMMTRRAAVVSLPLCAELLAAGLDADAQTQAGPAAPPGAPLPPVFKHDLPNVTMDDWEVTVSYVDYAPGRVGAAHRHPGFVLAYVLEGAVVAKISEQGEERTYSAGQMFYEQPGAPAGDDLREEGIDADDTRVARGAYAIPSSAVLKNRRLCARRRRLR